MFQSTKYHCTRLEEAIKQGRKKPSFESALAIEERTRDLYLHKVGMHIGAITPSKQPTEDVCMLLREAKRAQECIMRHFDRSRKTSTAARVKLERFEKRHKKELGRRRFWFASFLPDSTVLHQSMKRAVLKRRFPKKAKFAFVCRVAPRVGTKRAIDVVHVLYRECNMKK